MRIFLITKRRISFYDILKKRKAIFIPITLKNYDDDFTDHWFSAFYFL